MKTLLCCLKHERQVIQTGCGKTGEDVWSNCHLIRLVEIERYGAGTRPCAVPAKVLGAVEAGTGHVHTSVINLGGRKPSEQGKTGDTVSVRAEREATIKTRGGPGDGQSMTDCSGPVWSG